MLDVISGGLNRQFFEITTCVSDDLFIFSHRPQIYENPHAYRVKRKFQGEKVKICHFLHFPIITIVCPKIRG